MCASIAWRVQGDRRTAGECFGAISARQRVNPCHRGSAMRNPPRADGLRRSGAEVPAGNVRVMRQKGLERVHRNRPSRQVTYPAEFANVVSVAALDAAKMVASFSSLVADVALAGLGVGVVDRASGARHRRLPAVCWRPPTGAEFLAAKPVKLRYCLASCYQRGTSHGKQPEILCQAGSSARHAS